MQGVQWSERTEKSVESGRLNVVKYVNVTFPEGTYENVTLNPQNDEDAIVLGEIFDEVTDVKGSRLSDLLKNHPQSGRIKTVNDNSNRTLLKNVKVTLA